jgi:hypothetical protein
MWNGTERRDASGTRWHLHNVPSGDEQERLGLELAEYCSCCGLGIDSAVAWFDDEHIDRSLRVLHEHCFEPYDEQIRYLKGRGAA